MGSGSKLRGKVATPLKPGPRLSGTMMPTSRWERDNNL